MNIFDELFSLKNNGFPKNAGDIEEFGIIEEEEKKNKKKKKVVGGSVAPAPPGPTSLKGGRATESQARKINL